MRFATPASKWIRCFSARLESGCQSFSHQKLLALFREQHLQVPLTNTAYDDAMVSVGVFVKKVPSLAHLKFGSIWIEIGDRLAPLKGETGWIKQYTSAFFGTALALSVSAKKVDTLIVTGCKTSGCGSGFGGRFVPARLSDQCSPRMGRRMFDFGARGEFK